MQTDVKLQPDFLYPVGWIIMILLLMAAMIFLICHKKKKKTATAPAMVAFQRNAFQIQQEYLSRISFLEKEFKEGRLTTRETFYQISEIVRNFAFEMTGISVQNYSLHEIERLGISELTRLVNECYVPEFDELGDGDALATIGKTKEVIGTWNINRPLY